MGKFRGKKIIKAEVDVEYFASEFPDEFPLKCKERKNERGFQVVQFSDRYDQECSLQNSSLATEGAIWFGVDNTGPEIKGPNGKIREEVNARMHLSRKQVEQLLPYLHNFVEHGYIDFETVKK